MVIAQNVLLNLLFLKMVIVNSVAYKTVLNVMPKTLVTLVTLVSI